jgi:hypothetical protein
MKQTRIFCEKLAANPRALIVASKAVRKELTGETEIDIDNGSVGRLDKAKVIHFGSLRGLDHYKDYDTVVIIGRNQPNVQALEKEARALYWDSEDSLGLITQDKGGFRNLLEDKRGYRVRSGLHEEVGVHVHPDQDVQAILEQIRECESTQAIDRLRHVRASQDSEKKRVFILSNVVLDITVDHLWKWGELQRSMALWEEADGLLPLNKKHLMARCPSVSSESTATTRIAEIRRCRPLMELLISPIVFEYYSYRAKGQRVASEALVASDYTNPKETLSTTIGKSVAEFERVQVKTKEPGVS